MPVPTTRGRPLTADGHRDSAMLAMLDFMGRVDAQIELEQRHYRERRAVLTAMREDLRTAALSWTYGEVVEQQAAEQIATRMREGVTS